MGFLIRIPVKIPVNLWCDGNRLWRAGKVTDKGACPDPNYCMLPIAFGGTHPAPTSILVPPLIR